MDGRRHKRKRVIKYFATYTGNHEDIRLSGVGRIKQGQPFEVSEKVAKTLEQSKDFTIERKIVYIKI